MEQTSDAAPNRWRVAPHERLPLLVRLRRILWRCPLEEFEHEGERGERNVAVMRVAVILGFSALYLIQLLKEGKEDHLWLAATINATWLLLSILLWLAARSQWWMRGLPIVSSQTDVLGTTLMIGALLSLGDPNATASALVLVPCYSVIVVTTILRQDQRACLAAGGASMLQFTALVAWEHTSDLSGPLSWTGNLVARNIEVSSMIFLVTTTGIASLVLARVQSLQFAVLHDHLTGVYTRGYFEHRAVLEEARARRLGHSMVLAMVDLDHFKRVNDRFGHDCGDLALRKVAHLMRDALRRTDIVARYGGEEFVLLFLDADAQGVRDRLESLREAIAHASLPATATADGFSLTVSMGCAAFPEDGGSIEDVLRVADQRLLLAKETGRNRVVASNGAGGAVASPVRLGAAPAPTPG